MLMTGWKETVMILYQFNCVDCNEEHEEFCNNMNEVRQIEDEDPCTVCGGKLKQVITCGLVKFKGTGFTRRST